MKWSIEISKRPWISERNKKLIGEKALNWQGGKIIYKISKWFRRF